MKALSIDQVFNNPRQAGSVTLGSGGAGCLHGEENHFLKYEGKNWENLKESGFQNVLSKLYRIEFLTSTKISKGNFS